MKKEFEQKIVFNEILEDLKQFKNKNLYRCPYCDAMIEWDDVNYNPEESTYTCPKCSETFAEEELQNISMYDYIEEIYLTFLTNKGVSENE